MNLPDPLEISVKAAIAMSVADQFRRAGTHVTGDELSKIVDAEYSKVKYFLANTNLSYPSCDSSNSEYTFDPITKPSNQPSFCTTG